MKESYIRPKEILDEYLRLSSEDAKQLIQQKPPFQTRNCPACGDQKRSIAFEKLGFEYARCRRCDTLFVAKVPAEEQLNKFYQNSMSAEAEKALADAAAKKAREKVVAAKKAEQAAKQAAAKKDAAKKADAEVRVKEVSRPLSPENGDWDGFPWDDIEVKWPYEDSA